jgi:hypothetical protein
MAATENTPLIIDIGNVDENKSLDPLLDPRDFVGMSGLRPCWKKLLLTPLGHSPFISLLISFLTVWKFSLNVRRQQEAPGF